MAKIVYNSKIAKLVNDWIMPIEAITIFPFIFILKNDASSTLINHEKIHIAQQKECLFIPFFFIYALDYLINRLSGSGHMYSYMAIRFEQEAYRNEEDLNYQRERFAWLKYEIC
jgi:hypothetical protein